MQRQEEDLRFSEGLLYYLRVPHVAPPSVLRTIVPLAEESAGDTGAMPLPLFHVVRRTEGAARRLPDRSY